MSHLAEYTLTYTPTNILCQARTNVWLLAYRLPFSIPAIARLQISAKKDFDKPKANKETVEPSRPAIMTGFLPTLSDSLPQDRTHAASVAKKTESCDFVRA